MARILRVGDIVALVGPLGSGKTTLVQGLTAGWGYRRRPNSPTFALANEYKSRKGLLFHLDLYRLSPGELELFPLEEYFTPDTLCVMEWADRVRSRWPADTLEIRLTTVDPRARQARVPVHTKSWQKRLALLS